MGLAELVNIAITEERLSRIEEKPLDGWQRNFFNTTTYEYAWLAEKILHGLYAHRKFVINNTVTGNTASNDFFDHLRLWQYALGYHLEGDASSYAISPVVETHENAIVYGKKIPQNLRTLLNKLNFKGSQEEFGMLLRNPKLCASSDASDQSMVPSFTSYQLLITHQDGSRISERDKDSIEAMLSALKNVTYSISTDDTNQIMQVTVGRDFRHITIDLGAYSSMVCIPAAVEDDYLVASTHAEITRRVGDPHTSIRRTELQSALPFLAIPYMLNHALNRDFNHASFYQDLAAKYEENVVVSTIFSTFTRALVKARGEACKFIEDFNYEAFASLGAIDPNTILIPKGTKSDLFNTVGVKDMSRSDLAGLLGEVVGMNLMQMMHVTNPADVHLYVVNPGEKVSYRGRNIDLHPSQVTGLILTRHDSGFAPSNLSSQDTSEEYSNSRILTELDGVFFYKGFPICVECKVGEFGLGDKQYARQKRYSADVFGVSPLTLEVRIIGEQNGEEMNSWVKKEEWYRVNLPFAKPLGKLVNKIKSATRHLQ